MAPFCCCESDYRIKSDKLVSPNHQSEGFTFFWWLTGDIEIDELMSDQNAR